MHIVWRLCRFRREFMWNSFGKHMELNVPLTRTKAKEIGSFLEKLLLPIIGCQNKKKL